MNRFKLVYAMVGTMALSACGSHPASSASPLHAASATAAASEIRDTKALGAYVPEFSFAKTEFGHYWIMDHGKRIAIFASEKQGTTGYAIGLARQFPNQKIDEAKLKDFYYLDFIRMPGLRLQTDWVSAKAMKGVPGEAKFDTSDPTQLIINLSWKKSAEEFGTQVIRVVYDRLMLRYVVHVEQNLQLSQPGGGEYCNFYSNGLGDFARASAAMIESSLWMVMTATSSRPIT